MHIIMHVVHFTMHMVYSAQYNAHGVQCTLQCTWCTMHIAMHMVYNAHCNAHGVQCTIQWTWCIVQYTWFTMYHTSTWCINTLLSSNQLCTQQPRSIQSYRVAHKSWRSDEQKPGGGGGKSDGIVVDKVAPAAGCQEAEYSIHRTLFNLVRSNRGPTKSYLNRQ